MVAVYAAVNAFFGYLYFLCGPGALYGLNPTAGTSDQYWSCFFFSVQTLATIGYGQMSPVGWVAHTLVSIQALFGLVGVAMTTGVVFARFSRPTAKVVFSRQALVGTVDGDRLFYFRMANARMNQIAEARVRATLVRGFQLSTGERYRDFVDLKLVRDFSPLFSLTWTVEHLIDESSPLWRQTVESLRAQESEIIITVTGQDEGLLQQVMTRFSYTADDLLFEKRYLDMIERRPSGALRVHLDRIHEVV